MTEAKTPAPKRPGWGTALLLLALLVAVGLGLRWWRGPQVTVEPVLRRDLVQTVVASGRVLTPHRVDVGAQITGTVRRIPVAEGQRVKAGDVLLVLDDTEALAAERSADLAVAQAQGRLRQMRELQAPVAEQAQLQAQATLDNAQAQWQRSQALFQKGFIGEAALQEARKALTLAEAQSRTAQKQLESLASKGSDFALAEQAVAQAQANAQAAHARSQYTVVRAAADGQLIARNVEVGDVVQPGKVLMSLSPAGAVQLVINIDEKNLRLLALRQPALASADAYPQERFAATVAYINPGVNAQTGAVEVKLDVPQPPAHLQQDMTVSVDVEVARRPQALVLATHALHDAESPAPWVLVAQDNQAVRRNPRLGLRSGGWAEVLGGLNEGDAVLPAQAGVAEGARLRPLVRPAVAASAAAPAQDNR